MIDVNKIEVIQKRTKKGFLRQQKKYIKNINKAIKYNAKHGKSYIEVSLSEPFVSSNFVDKIVKMYEERGFEVEKCERDFYVGYLLITWARMEDF